MQDDLNRLIEELLARELRPNTREDIGTFRQELAAGTLSADDARYIRALHARVVEGGVPKARKIEEKNVQTSSEYTGSESLQAALAEARQREQALTAERDRLQNMVADLRREIDALKAEKR